MKKKHKQAIEEALKWINENFSPISVIVGGSIVRKKYDAGSDLDIYVIHNADFRQRFLKNFNDIPCDIFINNKTHIKKYFVDEYNKNRPTTAHLLTTGVIIYGKENVIELLKLAEKYANNPKKFSVVELSQKKHYILTLVEDAVDIYSKDELCCSYILNYAIREVIEYYYAINHKTLPRIKDRMEEIQSIQIKTTLSDFFNSTKNLDRIKFISLILDYLNIKNGNEEWKTEREK